MWEFPSSDAEDESVTLSCLLYSGRGGNNLCHYYARHSLRRTFWFRCFDHFHLFEVTKPQTQVPLVSIGHRTGQSTALWLAVVELLSAGFAPQSLLIIDARCVVLMSLSRHHSLGVIFRAVKGRT